MVVVAVAGGCRRSAPPPAPAAVAVATITLHDAARGRDVAVYVAAPTAAGGPWPLIVFSHGNRSSGQAMAGLFAGWAAHGYVCLAPTHDDSVSLRDAALAAGADEATLPTVGMVPPRGAGAAAMLDRAADLSFLIGAVPAIEAAAPAVRGRIDPARVGVGGHSAGAYTALLLAGATAEMDGVPRSAVNRRPLAFLTMAGLGAGQGGLTADSWRHVDRPLMNVTGSLDRVPRGLTAEHKRDPFALSPGGEKFEVFLLGANHGTFTCDPSDTFYLQQLGGSAQQQSVLFDDVHDVTLAFWDAELKGSAAAAAYLRSGSAGRRTGGRVAIEWR